MEGWVNGCTLIKRKELVWNYHPFSWSNNMTRW
jgi:hypothetical protein